MVKYVDGIITRSQVASVGSVKKNHTYIHTCKTALKCLPLLIYLSKSSSGDTNLKLTHETIYSNSLKCSYFSLSAIFFFFLFSYRQLRARRALLLYKVYGDSALLVLSRRYTHAGADPGSL